MTAEAAESSGPVRVVVHLVGPERVAAGLTNITNLRRDLGPASIIEVVVHGPAVSNLAEGSPVAAGITALLDDRITVDACRNSLSSQGLSSDVLIAGVSVVPSGVGHVIRLQEAGYLYLRP